MLSIKAQGVHGEPKGQEEEVGSVHLNPFQSASLARLSKMAAPKQPSVSLSFKDLCAFFLPSIDNIFLVHLYAYFFMV